MTLTYFSTEKPIVGMVHLDPLPGAPRATEELETVVESAVRDAQRLATGGVDGLMIENYGDSPFYPEDVPKHTVAAMTRVGRAVTEAVDCPIGINVLRNDAEAALSVAAAVEADYVRINVHTGAAVSDQGVIEGRAHETLRLRDRLGVDTEIFADLDVKHAARLAGERSIAEELSDLVDRGHADAVIVSGEATGESVDTDTLQEAAAACSDHGFSIPVLVGSGVTVDSVGELLAIADGAIVGTALKEGGQTTNPVSVDRVEQLMAAVERVRA
jgi:membrane complex biogenesis BtpA family protein